MKSPCGYLVGVATSIKIASEVLCFMLGAACRHQLLVTLAQGVFYGRDLGYLKVRINVILCPSAERFSLLAKSGRKDFGVCSPSHLGLDCAHHRWPAAEVLSLVALSRRVTKPEVRRIVIHVFTIGGENLFGGSKGENARLDEIMVIFNRQL